jgi:imidazolonepropionase-like amidohydrolase
MSATIWALATLVALVPAQDTKKDAKNGKKDERRSWTITAERVYTAAGDPIEGGEIVVSDGKIRGVGKGGGGDLEVYAVTPGLVDLSIRIDKGFLSVEQSNEITPHVRALASLDVYDESWVRAARGGVTTAMLNVPDRNVVGGLSVVLKTAGVGPAASRVIKQDAVLYGAIGSAPSALNHPAFGRPDDFYSRRPTTRMGVEWEWRKSLFEAALARQDSKRAQPGAGELQRALDGKLPLMIEAWASQDIRTAVFLVEEARREGWGDPTLIVDAAAEAWREPQLLVRSKASVVLPPFVAEGRTRDQAFFAWETAAKLDALGVPFALSGHNLGSLEDRLCYQPGYAMRGGLSFASALASVTTSPARMVGVDNRVGSIEAGKDADLVLWSGEPFQPFSKVIGVLVDGRLIVDPRLASAPNSSTK